MDGACGSPQAMVSSIAYPEAMASNRGLPCAMASATDGNLRYLTNTINANNPLHDWNGLPNTTRPKD